MKKKKLKEFKAIAAKYPDVHDVYFDYSKNPTKQVRLVNHYKKLKKFFRAHRDQFVEKYNLWLDVHVKNMVHKHPEMFSTVESTRPAT